MNSLVILAGCAIGALLIWDLAVRVRTIHRLDLAEEAWLSEIPMVERVYCPCDDCDWLEDQFIEISKALIFGSPEFRVSFRQEQVNKRVDDGIDRLRKIVFEEDD